MKEYVCVASYGTNEEEMFKLESKQILSTSICSDIDVEDDFKQLKEEIEKIVEGVNSTSISPRDSSSSPVKEPNNELNMSKVWGPRSDVDEGEIFGIKYDNIQNARRYAKKSLLIQPDIEAIIGKNTHNEKGYSGKIVEESKASQIYSFANQNYTLGKPEDTFNFETDCRYNSGYIYRNAFQNEFNANKNSIDKLFNSNNGIRSNYNHIQNNMANIYVGDRLRDEAFKPNSHNKNYIPKYTNMNQHATNWAMHKSPIPTENTQSKLALIQHNSNPKEKIFSAQTSLQHNTILYNSNSSINLQQNLYTTDHTNTTRKSKGQSTKKQTHINSEDQRSAKALDNNQLKINLDYVIKGKEKRSTIMIRNIPNKYQMKSLQEEIDQEFINKYDLVYLPLDKENKCNLGFAFINLIDPMHVVLFFNNFRGKKWKKFNSEKICELAYSKFQGKHELIAHFEKGSNKQYESDNKKSFVLLTPNQTTKIEMPINYLNKFLTVYPYSRISVNNEKFIVESLYNC